MNRQQLFCFGLGYSALALARRLIASGWSVTGTCRSADRQARLRAAGFAAVLFDRDRPVDVALLDGITHLLVSVPPDAAGDPVLEMHGHDIAVLPALSWLGYLSTTGVYGDRGGGWVDETAALLPTGERGRRRVPPSRAGSIFGVATGFRSISSASPRSTAPGAAPSMHCAPAPRDASTSRARCSRASMSKTWQAS